MTLPASAGYVALPTASVVSCSFDGKMVKYDRADSTESISLESEIFYPSYRVFRWYLPWPRGNREEDAVFILQPRASISSAIIGKDQVEGIHCRGTCTVTNVWWEDVCGGEISASEVICSQVHSPWSAQMHYCKLYRNCATSYGHHVTINDVFSKIGCGNSYSACQYSASSVGVEIDDRLLVKTATSRHLTLISRSNNHLSEFPLSNRLSPLLGDVIHVP